MSRMDNLEQDAIRRVLAGERDAYRVLMDRHLPAVLRLTLRITGNDVDAEEAAQEAFLRAYNKLPEFREQAAFGTWVYRIAVNCSLTLVERRNRDIGWNATPLHDAAVEGRFVISSRPSPEREYLNQESMRLRERAMLNLTPMERTAFVLRHLEEQPMEMIASALGISVNSAKQAVFRGVAKLRRELAPTLTVSPGSVSSGLAKASQ